MIDHRDVADAGRLPAAANSHGRAKKPRGKAALPEAERVPQNSLAVPPAVPLHLRPVLSYAEVAALGIAPERTLRRLVAIGRVKRSVIRCGRRVRFVVRDLIDELRQAGG